MKPLRDVSRLSVVGLIVLGLLAVVLSALALTRFRQVEAAPAPSPSASAAPTDSAQPSPTMASSPSAAVVSPSPSVTASSSATPSGPSVVVVGDSFSFGEPSETWVGPAAEDLGWGAVTNLSSPGRGFLEAPVSCDFAPCATFAGTIPAISAAQPDIVVTFGGTADGDYSLADPAAEYFAALREALPDAELVAISPVTGEDPAPYYLTMHSGTIRSGVEAVDGTFVDVGQPGAGDGEVLSPEAHAEIAAQVVGRLG